MTQLSIAKAEQAGFPPDLLIPILPHSARPGANCQPVEPNSLGKVPSYFNPSTGWWSGLGQWRTGATPEQRRTADAAGANCGLILGVPRDGRTFVALDVDTEWSEKDPASIKRAGEICQAVIRAAHAALGVESFWLRIARPARFAFLVELKDPNAGPKAVVKLAESQGNTVLNRGKIEILAGGQQVVIAGTHAYRGGTPIRWFRSDRPKESHSHPVVDELPRVANRAALNGAVEMINHALRDLGLQVNAHQVTSVARVSDLKPAEQAPPSAERLVAVLDAMPHGAEVSRQDYVNVMRAASGCIRALALLQRLTDDDRDTIRDAAIHWAARWDAGVTDEDQEAEKWEADYARNPADTLGWEFIVGFAISRGLEDLQAQSVVRGELHELSTRSAQEEFEATDEPPAPDPMASRPPSLVIETRPSDPQDGVPRRRDISGIDIPTSDIKIAEAVHGRLLGAAVWLTAEKRWITWDGPQSGWTSDLARSFLRNWVSDDLMGYVARHGENWTEATRAKLTSEARITAVEKILMDRLAARMDQINRADLTIQYPGGAYCLKTGRQFSTIEQRDLVETRCLGVGPNPKVATPKFDALLLHLACGDHEAADWIWAYLGYLLAGQPVEHILLIIYGPGGNGKGTLGRVMSHVFGSYGRTIDRGVVTEAGSKEHKTGLYQTRGKRLWYIDELDKSSKWNEAQVRAMTGGSEINARGMQQNDQVFRPEGSFLITTNFVPSFYRVDDAITRRFRILHARLKPTEDTKNTSLDQEIIAEEAPGIAARLIAEAQEFVERKMRVPPVPESMRGEANRFFAEQDTFYGWFSQECELGGGLDSVVELHDMRARYDGWLKRWNADRSEDGVAGMLEMMPQAAFVAALRRVGCLLDDSKGRRLARQRDGETHYLVAGVGLRIRAAA